MTDHKQVQNREDNVSSFGLILCPPGLPRWQCDLSTSGGDSPRGSRRCHKGQVKCRGNPSHCQWDAQSSLGLPWQWPVAVLINDLCILLGPFPTLLGQECAFAASHQLAGPWIMSAHLVVPSPSPSSQLTLLCLCLVMNVLKNLQNIKLFSTPQDSVLTLNTLLSGCVCACVYVICLEVRGQP